MNDDELQKTIALTLVNNVGPVIGKKIMQICGGPTEVFTEKKHVLLKIPYVNPEMVNQLRSKELLLRAEQELAFIKKNHIACYSFLSKKYPARLRHIPDAPILLYYKGTPALNHMRTLAIVGTRKVTERGKKICTALIRELAAYDICVFSGLAYGVDTHAHKCCVSNEIPTIGVLGHGLDMIYPSENLRLAKTMIAKGGILSEFVSGTKPESMHFPQRNRVVAMLSDGVLVVESAKSGGSMITADFALQYSKDVFAIPGHPEDKMAQGCNNLIKKTKAALIENAEDIANILSWTKKKDKANETQMTLAFELNEAESKIVNLLKVAREMELDSIQYRTSYPHSTLSTTLLNLEFKGIIKTLPGKKYILA